MTRNQQNLFLINRLGRPEGKANADSFVVGYVFCEMFANIRDIDGGILGRCHHHPPHHLRLLSAVAAARDPSNEAAKCSGQRRRIAMDEGGQDSGRRAVLVVLSRRLRGTARGGREGGDGGRRKRLTLSLYLERRAQRRRRRDRGLTLHFGSWDDVLRTMYAGIDPSDGGWGLGKPKNRICSLCCCFLFDSKYCFC